MRNLPYPAMAAIAMALGVLVGAGGWLLEGTGWGACFGLAAFGAGMLWGIMLFRWEDGGC